MTGRGAKVAQLFDRALDLGPGERTALLDAECKGNPALRKEVEALLAADSGAAAAALEEVTPHRGVELQPGYLVAGRYRVVRWLGEGGMGTVYEAEQLQPQRRVALKCLRAGPASAAALRRFHREAELLGRLRHPGIAQIVEAGFIGGSEEQPFFAMEYVQGPPLLDHARSLSLREQLELFAQVCDAVQHAHALGIVHRDLKPANILVDTGMATPCPKVLDFGVGRIAGQTQGTILTGTHEIVGTLAYLSPEQVSGGSAIVDARTDVWSLGVTLYQQLAGQLPLDLTGRSLPQAARVLEEEEPTRLERLLPAMRGDIATIVHKALNKEPSRRYADAGELAADLRRHLHNEPIAARPTSALYQWSRFARRHRALVAGLAATFLALVAGLAVSLHFLAGEKEQRSLAEGRANDLQVMTRDLTAQRGIATKRADDLRALCRDLIFDVESELAKVNGSTAARRKVMATGVRYAERLLQDAGDDPLLLLEVGVAFLELARILGDPSVRNLGDLPAAERTLAKAIPVLERALEHGANAEAALAGLRESRELEAELHRAQNRVPERLRALEQARDIAARMRERGDVEGADRVQAQSAINLGRLQYDLGRHAEALPNFELYVKLQRARMAAGDVDAPYNAALILGFVAQSRRMLGDGPGCRQALDEALAIAEQFHRAQPNDPRAQRVLIAMLRRLATDEIAAKRPADALPYLERQRALSKAMAPDQDDVATLREQALGDHHYASALIDLDRTPEALPVLASYQQQVEALLVRSPANRERAQDVMLGHQLAVRLHGKLGDEAAVTRHLTAALRSCNETIAADGTSYLAWQDLAETQATGAYAYATVAATAGDQAKAELRKQLIALLESESATLAKMVELHFEQAWIGKRQAAVVRMLGALRAGKDLELMK